MTLPLLNQAGIMGSEAGGAKEGSTLGKHLEARLDDSEGRETRCTGENSDQKKAEREDM